ncbi:phasin-related domain-containing protein [Moritella viscosa]|uniref:phasin-related domain-containing protein n=1 Tax=Moritella viscosa TaxID=80854 RepID=UPI00090FBB7B|nr:phasin family protein [Moritella viscosa]SHO13047.1 Putative uncharacterized protein [Moritella viscosa]SHO13133.1 Putative uncharacterized protein [Moritella viscosa]SHO18546.1 Putative uncharacterized protein [Moritella viscosa]
MSKVITAAKQAWSAKDQITRNIWLAGLGAYDKGYQSASNTVTKSQSIFDELVERGRKLEADTTQTLTSQKDKLTSASQCATDALQDKVHKAVTTLTHIDVNAFDSIMDKIDQIEKALADAKIQQNKEVIVEVEAIKDVVEKVEIAVTEKVASVSDQVTTAVETVAEVVAPTTSNPVVKEASEVVVAVKQTAKKVSNKRVKRAVAKKK